MWFWKRLGLGTKICLVENFYKNVAHSQEWQFLLLEYTANKLLGHQKWHRTFIFSQKREFRFGRVFDLGRKSAKLKMFTKTWHTLKDGDYFC